MSSRTPYHASQTGQITEPGDPTSTLVVHEDGGGRPLCNVPIRPWKGKALVWTPQGPGTVNCGICVAIHEAQTTS